MSVSLLPLRGRFSWKSSISKTLCFPHKQKPQRKTKKKNLKFFIQVLIKEFISIHTVSFPVSLMDNVIILYIINMKTAISGFTRLCQTTLFLGLYFFFVCFFFTPEYRSIKISETKKKKALWNTNTFPKCRTNEVELSCHLPECPGNTHTQLSGETNIN